jgi:hypothetical protein
MKDLHAAGGFPAPSKMQVRTREMAREGKIRVIVGVFSPGAGDLTVFFVRLTTTII